MSGLLITMEGVEGSGKSTQIQRLADRLNKLKVPLVVSKEPGGTILGRELRSLLLAPHESGETWCPKAELLLFYADRAQHLARVLGPALEAGNVVLVDRFEDSTRAYQGAQGVSEAALDKLSDVVLGRLKPHMTILLDADPEVVLKRVEARNAAQGGAFKETRFDQETLEFHVRVRKRFLALAQNEPQRIVSISAQDTPDQVESAIWSRLSALLRNAGHTVE